MITDRKQVTTRVYVRPAGQTGWRGLGDVTKSGLAPEISRATLTRFAKGRREQCGQLVGAVHHRWQVTLAEDSDWLQELLALAGPSAVTQSAATAATFTWSGSALGDGTIPDILTTAQLPHTVLTAWTYTGQGNPVYGTDYVVDMLTGKVSVLTEYFGNGNYRFSLSYDAPAVINWSALTSVRQAGEARLVEYDQHSEIPREVHDCTAEWRVTPAGEATGEQPAEFTLEITGRDSIRSRKRV